MSGRYSTVSLAAAGALPHRGAPAIFNQGGQVIQGPVANDRTKPQLEATPMTAQVGHPNE